MISIHALQVWKAMAKCPNSCTYEYNWSGTSAQGLLVPRVGMCLYSIVYPFIGCLPQGNYRYLVFFTGKKRYLLWHLSQKGWCRFYFEWNWVEIPLCAWMTHPLYGNVACEQNDHYFPINTLIAWGLRSNTFHCFLKNLSTSCDETCTV